MNEMARLSIVGYRKISAYSSKMTGGGGSPNRKFRNRAMEEVLAGTSSGQVSEKSEEQTLRPGIRIVKRWPRILFRTGVLLFWLACYYSAALPFAAILVGPV